MTFRRAATIFFSQLAFTFLLSTHSAFGDFEVEGSSQSRIKALAAKLEAEVCAAPSEKAVDSKMEGDVCIECSLSQPTTDLPASTKDIGNAITAATEMELEEKRIDREIKFLELLNDRMKESGYGPSQLSNTEMLKLQLNGYKDMFNQNKDLQKTMDLLLAGKGASEEQAMKLRQMVGYLAETQKSVLWQIKAAIAGLQKSKEKVAFLPVPNENGNYIFVPKSNQDALKLEQEAESKLKKLELLMELLSNSKPKNDMAFTSTSAKDAIIHFKSELEKGQTNLQKLITSLESGLMDQKKTSFTEGKEKVSALTGDESLSSKNGPLSEKRKKLEELEQTIGNFHVKKAREDVANNACGMSTAEILAVSEYSGSAYQWLNKALRAGGEEAEKVKPFKEVLNAALKKLRPVEVEVKRGGNLPNDVLKEHVVGATVTYSAFTSSSISEGFNSRHRFVVRSKTGRYIEPFSQNKGEYEVLFPAETRFKVVSRIEGHWGAKFVLEQVEGVEE